MFSVLLYLQPLTTCGREMSVPRLGLQSEHLIERLLLPYPLSGNTNALK
jgi:hypothetical protein